MLTCAKVLLANGANINARSVYGWTALMMAAGEGHLEVTEARLSAANSARNKLVVIPDRIFCPWGTYLVNIWRQCAELFFL